jgi:hypothetical protein
MRRALSLSKTTTKSGSQNLEDQGHQEIPEIIFSRNTHKFQDRDYQKFKKELPKYDDKDHRGVVVLDQQNGWYF